MHPVGRILSILTFVGVCSCNSTSNLPLPSSVGDFDQVMIVIDDKLKVELRDSIIKYFEAPYQVLNQPEVSLDVATAPYTKLNSLMKRFRNMIFIGLKDGTSSTDRFVQSQVSETYNNTEFKRNMWSQPQIGSFVLMENKEKLKKSFAEIALQLRANYLRTELSEYKQLAYISGVNQGLKKQLLEYYGFQIDIPQDYVLAKNEQSFIWLRRDDPESTINIMIYVQQDSTQAGGVEIRNQLGKLHVASMVEGAYMSTDTLIPVMRKNMTINGTPAEEIRGLWRMHKDFKGGPFLNVAAYDKKTGQSIYFDGFIYAPGEKKKGYLRQLEAIFSTFKVDPAI